MKFKKLVTKFDKLASKKAQGEPVKNSKMEKLHQLLAEKKDRYEAKLAEIEDDGKRKKLQNRIKIVNAQLAKAKRLLG